MATPGNRLNLFYDLVGLSDSNSEEDNFDGFDLRDGADSDGQNLPASSTADQILHSNTGLAAFRELVGNSDSDDSDFEGYGPISDSSESEGEFELDIEIDTSPQPHGAPEAARPRARQQPNLAECYDHDWLPQFTQETGITFATTGDEPEVEIFSKFIDDDFVSLLVQETNRYAEQYFQNNPKDSLPPHSLARSWKNVDLPEMRAFLGILLYMGMVKLPTYKSYWSTDALMGMKGFRHIMSRDRWTVIWMFFHVSDNNAALPREHPDYDRASKIRPIIDKLVHKFQEVYLPDQNLSVDESLIAFKGRTTMLQYMPQKPHKWGLKGWALCEAKTGYCINWNIYTGKKQNIEHGLAYKTVLDISAPVLNKGHHIYMDNFFSSPTLFTELANRGTGACGTLRPNRVGTPPEIKAAKLKKNDPPKFVRNGNIMYIAWMDKKQVSLITSLHNDAVMAKTVRCRDPANQNRREIQKPMAIEAYNQFMSGVDLVDQKLWTYLSVHRSVKWWKKVFVYLLELAFVQFTIVWQKIHNRPTIDKFALRLSLIKQLVAGYQRPPRLLVRNMSNQNMPGRLTGRHFLAINAAKTKSGHNAYPDCTVCSSRKRPGGRRHQTQYMCPDCDRPMCPYPCFQRYHTLQNFKVVCTKELHIQ